MMSFFLSKKVVNSCMGKAKDNNKDVIYIHVGSEIFISYGNYETSCVFYNPEPLARGYKIRNEFHNRLGVIKHTTRFINTV